jgi:hypothetical protein
MLKMGVIHEFGISAEGLEFAEKIHDLCLIPIHGSNEFASDDSFLIDYVSLGKLECAVKVVAFLAGIPHGEQIHFVVFQELVVRAVVVIDAYRQNFDSFIFHTLLQGFERWQLLETRRAPGSPKIQNHNLATIITKSDFAIRVLHREVRSNGSDAGWLRATITAR